MARIIIQISSDENPDYDEKLEFIGDYMEFSSAFHKFFSELRSKKVQKKVSQPKGNQIRNFAWLLLNVFSRSPFDYNTLIEEYERKFNFTPTGNNARQCMYKFKKEGWIKKEGGIFLVIQDKVPEHLRGLIGLEA